MPLFSVLIPTLNRAHLLKYALQSALAQEYDDYEVIVSDNDSSDDTDDLVRSFADKRIRYVRPNSYLYVHDHWNFAIQRARGQYVQILPDDDCLASTALSALAHVIQTDAPAVIGWQGVDYFSSDFLFASQRNRILIRDFSGQSVVADSRTVLTDFFQFRSSPYFPAVQGVSIKKSVVDAIFQRVGYFFAPPFPEFVAFPMAFAFVGQYIFLERPFVVVGRTPDSIGPREFWFNLDPTWREVGSDLFRHVPLRGTYWTNGLTESLLKAKHNLPDKFEGIELSYEAYYRKYYGDMLGQRARGRKIQRDLEEYRHAVKNLPPDLQEKIRAEMKRIERAQFRQSLKDNLLSTARRTSLGAMAAAAKKRLVSKTGGQNFIKTPDGYVIRGEQVQVTDILTCAKWLTNLQLDELLRRSAH